MSLKQKALSGLFWTFIQQFSSQGITFLVQIILARLLAPEEFGLIAMLGIFMGIGNALISGGLSSSLIRAKELEEDDYSTVFYFNLLGSVIIYGVVFVCAPFISAFYDQPLLINILRVYSLTFIINAFGAIQLTRLTRLMDFKTQMKISIPSTLLGGLIGVIMACNGFGVWSLVSIALVQSFSTSFLLWSYAKWRPLLVFKSKKFKYHFNFGIKLMFSGMLEIIFINSFTIIIGKYFAPRQVGFYNRAESLHMLPVSNISLIVSKVTYPLFASIQNDDIQLKKVYKKIMQMVIYLVAPTLVLMAVLAEPLFRFLFTEKWLPAVPYFRILCLNGILYPIHAYNLQILNVKGRSDLFLRLEIIKKLLVIFVLFFSFQFAIYGLLVGGVITSILAFFINTHFSGKFINYSTWEQIKDLLPILILSALVGLLFFIIDLYCKDFFKYDFVRLFIGGFFGLLSFVFLSSQFKMTSFIELKNLLLKK